MSKAAKKPTTSSAAPKGPAHTAKPQKTQPAKISPKPERAKSGSKQSRVIAMLQSPAGATIGAMMKVTGWQQHSVRGFLAGVVRNRLKLKLNSKKVDGDRIYQIASGKAGKTTDRRSKRASV